MTVPQDRPWRPQINDFLARMPTWWLKLGSRFSWPQKCRCFVWNAAETPSVSVLTSHITHLLVPYLTRSYPSIHPSIHPSYTFITFYYPVVLLPAVHISPSRRFEAKCKDHISLVVIEKVPKITTHRPMWKWRYSKKPGCCPLINCDAPPIRYLVGGLELVFYVR